MQLHPHVIEALEHSKKFGDERLGTIKKLTEERPAGTNNNQYSPDFRDYESMWKAIQKAESVKGNLHTNAWVFDFIDAVDDAQNFPKYASLNGENRKKLITQLHNFTEGLQRIYRENKYDEDVILNDGFFSYGFTAIAENGEPRETDTYNKISMIEALEFYSDSLAGDISFANRMARTGKDVDSRLFIRYLAKRNIARYGQPHNAVVGIASWCIFGKYYPPNTVSSALRSLSG